MAANKLQIDTKHKQIYSTCLLSSFAIVGNYFMQEKVEVFFKNYYDHFFNDFYSHGVNYIYPQFGFCQSAHINHLGPTGYQILFDLYTSSQQSVFIKCRDFFYAEKTTLVNDIIQSGTFIGKNINEFLSCTSKNSIINVFINRKNNNYSHPFNNVEMHSITVYFDDVFYFHDTVKPQEDIKLSDNWWNYDSIGDVLIYWGKT